MRITTNQKHLKVNCTDVESVQEGEEIAKKLRLTCSIGTNLHAVGLAHNQVGGTKNVYVAKIDGKWEYFYNASIVDSSNEVLEHYEECMSYPGKPNGIQRHTWVTVRYLTSSGYKETKYYDMNAYIHQHEIDHINGYDIHNQKEK